MQSTTEFLTTTYPELLAGGFSRYDGTIEFYGRINALLENDFAVLDCGAGRAAWYDDESCDYKKRLRLMKGKVRMVIGQDIDPAVMQNRTLDEARLTKPGEQLPFPHEIFDLIIADYVFEHIDNPDSFCSELARVLKPGGWICARTPNKWGYVSVATRLISNSRHRSILKMAQPHRNEIDVFPTRFLLNTMRTLSDKFPPKSFESYSYYYQAEPTYHFHSKLALHIMRAVDALLPPFLSSSLFIFIRKRKLG